MVIDIGSQGRKPSLPANTTQNPGNNKVNTPVGTQPPAAPTAAPAAPAPAQTGVFISQEAQVMQKLAQQLKDPPVQQGKVAQLKQAISNRTYTINPERIAQKLLLADENAPSA